MNVQESLAVRARVDELNNRIDEVVDRLVQMIDHLTKRVENLTRKVSSIQDGGPHSAPSLSEGGPDA